MVECNVPENLRGSVGTSLGHKWSGDLGHKWSGDSALGFPQTVCKEPAQFMGRAGGGLAMCVAAQEAGPLPVPSRSLETGRV